MSAQHYAAKEARELLCSVVVAYVTRQPQPVRFTELFELFGTQLDCFHKSQTFRNRLGLLVRTGQLQTHGEGAARCYSLAGTTPAPVHRYKPALLATTAPMPTMRVPPRQHNVMLGTYQPPRAVNLRPGALDYARVPSRGVAC